MGSGASRTKRSTSGRLYRAGTAADGEPTSPKLITEEDSVRGLPDLGCPRKLAHPSKAWRARLLAVKSVEVLSCRWSPDDDVIAAAYFDGGLRFWDASTGALLHTLHLDDSEDQEYVDRGIKYYSKGDMLEHCTTSLQWKPGARGDRRELLTVDTEGKACVYKVPRGGEPPSLSWSVQEALELRSCDWVQDDRGHVAVGGFSRKISVYDLEIGSLVTSLAHKITVSGRITGHTKRIHKVRCACHEPDLVLSAAWDHAALLWDLRSANVVRHFTAPDLVMNGGEPADLSTSGDMVVTASDIQGGDVTLWDAGGRGVVAKAPCAYSRPTSVQFSKDESSLAIAVGARGMANCGWLRRAEEAAAGEGPRWSLSFTGWSPQPGDVWAVDWAHRSRRVCVGAVDGTVAVLEQ